MRFFFYIVGGLFFVSNSSATDKILYYCSMYHKDKISAFDQIVDVVKIPEGRKIFTGYYGVLEFIKTYDEDNKITTVYKDRFSSPHETDAMFFRIFQLDLSSNFLTYSLGYYMTEKDFQTSYQVPLTKYEFSKINRNPELLRYLPEQSNPDHITFAFSKNSMQCESMNYLEYIYKSFFLFFISILSA